MFQITDNGTRVELNLSLTRNEWDALILMAGMATGAAFKNCTAKLAFSFLAIANKMNEGNPNWVPYEIPEEPG